MPPQATMGTQVLHMAQRSMQDGERRPAAATRLPGRYLRRRQACFPSMRRLWRRLCLGLRRVLATVAVRSPPPALQAATRMVCKKTS